MLKNAAWFLLSFLTGAVFLFSAYAKLFPIELFEYTFVDIGVSNFGAAPWIARLFIGLEFAFGISLVFCLYGKNQWVLKANLLFMVVLSIYLVILWIFKGNDHNCGCFGQLLDLSPAESLLKNLLMIAGLLLLWLFFDGWKTVFAKYLIPLLSLLAISLPFILNPIGPVPAYSGTEQIGRNLVLDSARAEVQEELMKGKDVVAFMSLTCSHCRIAGYKMQIMKNKHPEWPFYFILNGDKKHLKSFYRETQAEKMPFEMMSVKEGFMANSGPAVPAIFYTEEGKIVKRINYLDLNEDSVAAWLDGVRKD